MRPRLFIDNFLQVSDIFKHEKSEILQLFSKPLFIVVEFGFDHSLNYQLSLYLIKRSDKCLWLCGKNQNTTDYDDIFSAIHSIHQFYLIDGILWLISLSQAYRSLKSETDFEISTWFINFWGNSSWRGWK